MKKLLLLLFAVACYAQEFNVITILPNQAHSTTGALYFQDSSGINSIGFQAPTTVTGSVLWKLPAADSAGCFNSDGAGTLTIVSCSGGGLPTSDSTNIVKDDADATKLMRFEIGGFTTNTTRVLTPQDANTTIAGVNLNNNFTVDQLPDTNNTRNLGNNAGKAWATMTSYITRGESIEVYCPTSGCPGPPAFTNFMHLGMPAINQLIFYDTTSTPEITMRTGAVSGARSTDFDSNIIPVTDNVRLLGLPNLRWADFQTMTATFGDLATFQGKISLASTIVGNVLPDINNTYSLGSSNINRWKKLWVVDIDCSGVCPGGGGGGGTVTSIATTSPITGGVITTTGTIACATCVTTDTTQTITGNKTLTGVTTFDTGAAVGFTTDNNVSIGTASIQAKIIFSRQFTAGSSGNAGSIVFTGVGGGNSGFSFPDSSSASWIMKLPNTTPTAGQCLGVSSFGGLFAVGAWQSCGTISSISGTSPIVVSPTTGAVVVTCPNCVDIGSAQTITGAKTFNGQVNTVGGLISDTNGIRTNVYAVTGGFFGITANLTFPSAISCSPVGTNQCTSGSITHLRINGGIITAAF